MARLFFTLFLFAACLLSVFALLVESGEGRLATLFSPPPLTPGSALAEPSSSQRVTSLTLVSSKARIELHREGAEWWMTSPKRLRADYRLVEQMLLLCRTLVVKDVLPAAPPPSEVITLDLGYADGTSQSVLLGRALPLFHDFFPRQSPSSAALGGAPPKRLQAFEASRPGSPYFYAVYSSEQALPARLDPDAFYDRRPFFFHPEALNSLTYDDGQSRLLLQRESPSSPWKIVHPLPLRTDPEAVAAWIRALYELEAAQMETGPDPLLSPPLDSRHLTLGFFNSTLPNQTLQLTGPRTAQRASPPPESPVRYTFRPDTLSEMMPPVSQLRSKTLSAIKVSAVDFLLLQSKYQTSPVTLAIRTTTQGQPRWMFESSETDQAGWQLASEPAVAKLFEALTKDSVKSYTTQRLSAQREPDKSITVYAKSGERVTFDLFFHEGQTLIGRRGEPQLAEIHPATAAKFKTEPHQWKDPALWKLSPIELKGVMRESPGKPTELYSYDYLFEDWTAQVGTEVVSDLMDPVAAKRFLNSLETLTVERWLRPNDPLVRTLTEPSLTFTAQTQQRGSQGDSRGLQTYTLRLYPLSRSDLFSVISLTTGTDPRPQYALINQEVARLFNHPLLYDQ